MRRRLATALRSIADRIDYGGSPKATGLSFTFEPRQGLVINDKGVGCPLWYLGDDDHERAYADAGSELSAPTWAIMARNAG